MMNISKKADKWAMEIILGIIIIQLVGLVILAVLKAVV